MTAKLVDWSDEDGVYIGRCTDLITGIHGDDPARAYVELCQILDEVIERFQQQGLPLPPRAVRPMRDVV